MSNVAESSVFEAGIYQLEITDPVQGGPTGVANLQAKQLANRTRWLKDQIDALAGTSGALAPLASPAFTGTPTAPTAGAGDNTTKVATTEFVQNAISGIATVNVAGGSNVALTSAQWGCGIIILTGVVTANINVIFPTQGAGRNRWVVLNSTTGGFTIVCKTAGGSGVLAMQGEAIDIFGDATNIRLAGGASAPAGTIIAFGGAAAPNGYLKCDGSAVSRTTYAALFTAIGTAFGGGDGVTTFNVPDLRGEFIRGYDDGRGADPGRGLGSWQADAFKSHSHPIQMTPNSGLNRVLQGSSGASGTTDNTGAVGGTETRPRNVAALYCIKT